MKNILFCLSLLLSIHSLGQKEEKIKINNSRIAFAVEVEGLSSSLSLTGDSKYYNSVDNYFNNGYDNPNIKDYVGYDIGSNMEFHIIKNSRKASFNIGLHYINHGDPIFISQGDITNGFPKKGNEDESGYLKMQSLRIPLFFQLRLFKIFGNEGIGIEAGANFDYLLNAKIKPGKIEISSTTTYMSPQVEDVMQVTDAFFRFSINMFVGFRVQIGPVYLNGRFCVLPAKNIFKSTYAVYGTGERKFEETYLTFGVGVFLKR
ncbi:MAG: hypothetical protein NTW16_17715 [Bacteroidetes bacterium]|nr:hypothetical protein [Bacteroidota bacterium]